MITSMSVKISEELGWEDLHRCTNRPINRAHVDSLKRLIKKLGYLKMYPILVTPTGGIIDGQHRWTACQELDVVGHFVVVNPKEFSPDVAAEAVRGVKGWTAADRTSYDADLGNKSAAEVMRLVNAYNSSVAVIFRLAGVNSRGVSITASPERIAAAEPILRELVCFDPVIPNGKVYKNWLVTTAYSHLRSMDGFDYTRFCQRLKAHGPARFVSHSRVLDMLRNLISIYNFHTPIALTLTLTSEIERKASTVR